MTPYKHGIGRTDFSTPLKAWQPTFLFHIQLHLLSHKAPKAHHWRDDEPSSEGDDSWWFDVPNSRWNSRSIDFSGLLLPKHVYVGFSAWQRPRCSWDCWEPSCSGQASLQRMVHDASQPSSRRSRLSSAELAAGLGGCGAVLGADSPWFRV